MTDDQPTEGFARARRSPLSRDGLPQNVFGGFRSGLGLLGEGIGFLRRERRLWPLAVVPILFAMVSVGSISWLFWLRHELIHEACVAFLPILEATSWWSWLWVGPGKLLLWLIAWFGVLVAFGMSLLAALLTANLFSAPFLDQLSVRVEAIETGAGPKASDAVGDRVGETLRSFTAEFQRLMFLVALWGSLSLAGFIFPGAHFVTGPLLVVATVLLLPLDYAGFALDRRRFSFRRRRRWLVENLPTMIGFGGVAFVACLVPGLNLFLMPALVTAGTRLVLRTTPQINQ
ncbi:MAG: EI24 domain-containing protein [Myxococcota bacterium]